MAKQAAGGKHGANGLIQRLFQAAAAKSELKRGFCTEYLVVANVVRGKLRRKQRHSIKRTALEGVPLKLAGIMRQRAWRWVIFYDEE